MLVRRLALAQDPGAPNPGADHDKPVTGEILRVAIATRDGQAVNAHFGSAKRFVVYDVSERSARFIETIAFDEVSDESGNHTRDGDDRNGAKISALAGTGLLVVQAIGGPVAARVIRAGIHPIKLANGESVAEVVQQVQALLGSERPPWLRKVLQKGRERSMDFLDDDD